MKTSEISTGRINKLLKGLVNYEKDVYHCGQTPIGFLNAIGMTLEEYNSLGNLVPRERTEELLEKTINYEVETYYCGQVPIDLMDTVGMTLEEYKLLKGEKL